MGNVVVSWKDNKGVEYHATVIYNPDTGTTYYWRSGDWVSVTVKEKIMKELTPTNSNTGETHG